MHMKITKNTLRKEKFTMDPCKNANRMPILDSHLILNLALVNESRYSGLAQV